MDNARCTGGLPRGFLQPSLLLLLGERPGYGYDLVARLKELGLDDDSGTVYRALRALEAGGAVYSYWNTSDTGPARRMYRLTGAGEEMLQSAVQSMTETYEAIGRWLRRSGVTHRYVVPVPANGGDGFHGDPVGMVGVGVRRPGIPEGVAPATPVP
jgi:PadR family transcriptional regulator PadR